MVSKAAPITRLKPPLLQLQELIEQYRVCNSIEGKSQKTIHWYTDLLTLFLAYLSRSGLPADLSSINITTARSYIHYLQERKKLSKYPGTKSTYLSPKTVQCHVRTLKAFSSWLFGEKLIPENLFAVLKIPKAPRKIKEPLTQDEILRIFRCMDKSSPLGLRDYVILVLMLDTGLRASEACFITLALLNLEQGYIKVMGKGGKERLVPIGDITRKTLYRYIEKSRPKLLRGSSDALFLTKDGNMMTYNAMKIMFDELKKTSGITRLHAHLCRHTFAINYLVNGGDVFTLKEILGHTTLEMVNAYLNFTTAQISIQHHRFSPMDHLKI
jgi:site-specific recombinase XerD